MNARMLAMLATLALLVASPTHAQDRFARRRFTLDRFTEGGRSILQPRQMMPDARRLPRFHERQTHRGFEMTTAQYEVVAPTKALAGVASEHFARGWAAAEQLAIQTGWDTKANNFAQRVAVLLVDGEQKALPRETREYENQSQYVVQLRTDRLDAGARHAIRAAACRSFLYGTQWNRQLPGWFQYGLSEWAAAQDDADETAAPIRSRIGAPGSFRSARSIPATRVAQDDAALAAVAYFLESNGGEHGWQVLDALRDRPNSFARLQQLRGAAQGADLEQIRLSEPRIQLADTEGPSAMARQQGLYVLLRLAERARVRDAAGDGGARTSVGITEFKDGKQAVAEPLSSVTSGTRQPEAWRSAVAKQLRQPRWSVLGLDRRLLEARDSARLLEQLKTVSFRYEDEQWTVADETLTASWSRPGEASSLIRFAIKDEER